MEEERPSTVVLGIDGAHFELIEPWMDAGDLPNLKRAVESGVTADLQSVLPPVTSPNWKAYLTGKNPGKFGIFWWENIDTARESVYYPHDRKQVETEFWELLAEEDRTGIINVPTTYPPKEHGKFAIAGAPDGKNHDYTYPKSLEEHLESEHEYGVTLENNVTVSPAEAAREIHEKIDSRFTVALELMNEHSLSFLQVTTFYINTLHHYFWDHDYTRKGWKIVDDHLGKFLDEGYNVILMSDHGSTEIQTVFHVNTWLESQGYLELDTGVADLIHNMGINRERILRVLSTLNMERIIDHVPQRVRNLVPNEQGELHRVSKASNIDWEKSDAIASGQGPIYLNIEPGTERYDQVRKDLTKGLESLTDPDGRPIARKVHKREDVYSGRFRDEAPDLVVEQADGVHIQGNIGRDDVFTNPHENGWVAENKRNGLFVATGPSFGSGKVAPLSILDLAPTILHLHSKSIPLDMDGEPRTDVFHTDSLPRQREPQFREEDDRDREEERIRTIVREAILS